MTTTTVFIPSPAAKKSQENKIKKVLTNNSIGVRIKASKGKGNKREHQVGNTIELEHKT